MTPRSQKSVLRRLGRNGACDEMADSQFGRSSRSWVCRVGNAGVLELHVGFDEGQPWWRGMTQEGI